MNKTKEIQNKKINARLYPIYKMFSWDLLFYYSIIYLFLTQVKNFSASQILLSEAFFTTSCLVLQIPMGILVDKLGKKKSLVFANLCMCIFIAILMLTQNYVQLLITLFIDAVGYVVKGICETNILYDSLPRGKKRGHLYSTIDGVGSARYYIIDAVTSLIAGFTFVIQPYLPLILCLIGNIIATILSTRFKHTQMPSEESSPKTSDSDAKEYLKQLKEAISFSIKSKRMLCLLIFFGLISGLNYNLTTFRGGILKQIQLPEQYFGIVFAIIQIAAATFAGMQSKIHKRFRNRTLSVLGLNLTIPLILVGMLANGNIEIIKTILIISLFVLMGGIKGAHNVLTYRYLNNFTNRKIRIKLATVRNLVYNIFSILISLLGAWLLSFSSAGNSVIIIGIISSVILILLLHYMKDKVGLTIEKYSSRDLKYSHIKNFQERKEYESKTRI